MSIFSLYSSTPLPGKAQLMETRLRTVLGIIAQKGAIGTRLHQDRIGANAGNMAMVAELEIVDSKSMTTAMETANKVVSAYQAPNK